MKYAVEMGSFAMIYIASFVKISSGIQRKAHLHVLRRNGSI
jgi:hypothetical protein